MYQADGSPLSGELLVNTTTAGFQGNPVVGADDGGNFVVAWDGNGTGDSQGVFVQRFDSTGTKIGTEIRVNANTGGTQSNPTIAIEPNGNFTVAWRGAVSGDSDGAAFRRFNSAGSALTGETLVNTFTTGAQNNPHNQQRCERQFRCLLAKS